MHVHGLIAALGLIAFRSLVSCFGIQKIADPSSYTLSQDQQHPQQEQQQQVLQVSETGESSSVGVGKVVEIPLERKITVDGRFYFLNVSVGTPGQQLKVLLDTGSTDAWVYGKEYCGSNRYLCCKSV